ncbi:MAG: hypothetical protein GTO41_11775, partial [Burkholderiales bacterium]|nr:hypothetical protein [Burkholderiales bacterium]
MNRNRGHDGTWGYAEELQRDLLTIEIASDPLTEGAYMLRGFYDEK